MCTPISGLAFVLVLGGGVVGAGAEELAAAEDVAAEVAVTVTVGSALDEVPPQAVSTRAAAAVRAAITTSPRLERGEGVKVTRSG
jgi:hypothetical protein